MEFKPKATVCALLLALFLLSSYGGESGSGMAEARVCTGKSAHHSFPCVLDKHCTHDCLQERDGGWTAGYRYFRVCTCQKRC